MPVVGLCSQTRVPVFRNNVAGWNGYINIEGMIRQSKVFLPLSGYFEISVRIMAGKSELALHDQGPIFIWVSWRVSD